MGDARIISKLDIRKRFPAAVESVVNLRALRSWGRSGYGIPAPPGVKRATIRRHAVHGSTFVETGTFFGDTSAFARLFSSKVVTIEPSAELYAAAVKRFASSYPMVEVINASSEIALPEVVKRLDGDVTFWLDGHYSGGITFEGERHSPLLGELQCIGPHLSRLGAVTVLVDDIHACGTNPGYPPMATVLKWADIHQLSWQIEHDILILKKPAG